MLARTSSDNQGAMQDRPPITADQRTLAVALERSTLPIARQLIKRVLIVDVVARESVQAAPWICYMLQFVPFSPAVYVAGSVGTWLAEYDIHRTRPLWDPNDIDVFMMVHSPLEYHKLCDQFVASFATTPTIRIAVHRKYNHILNVRWWITVDGAQIVCPEFSLIHVPSILLPETLVQQFDINICKVAVNVWAGHLSLEFCLMKLILITLKEQQSCWRKIRLMN